jgi:hypothetical protein
MLHSLKSLERMSICAIDGAIGSISDVYFDAQSWTVRYLVVTAGNTWLPGRKVLISPMCVRCVFWKLAQVDLTLTRNQVRNSPAIDTNKPLSRQHEIAYFDYYGYPYYWAGPLRWGAMPVPPAFVFQGRSPNAQHAAAGSEEASDPHLRGLDAVRGCHIEAIDGSIGHVQDFLFSEHDWALGFLLIDTRNWLPGPQVAVPIKWVEDVDWNEGKVRVRLTRDAIRECPQWHGDLAFTPDYEDYLAQYSPRGDSPAARRDYADDAGRR